MSRLRISLLGGVSARSRSGPDLEIPASSSPLLGYLIVNRHRPLTRAEVAEVLWQETDATRARRCLSTALWRLRQAIPKTDIVSSKMQGERISLNWSLPGWIDVVIFERKAAAGLDLDPTSLGRKQLRHLQEAAALYRGDLLAGLDDDWVMIERQRLRNIYLDVLMRLAEAHDARQESEAALIFARRLSALDPLREDVHRLIMRLFIKGGNRGKAIEQYRICQGELGSELGVEPMEETKALYAEIVGARASDAAQGMAGEGRSLALGMVSEHLELVRRALAASDKRLAASQGLVSRLQRQA